MYALLWQFNAAQVSSILYVFCGRARWLPALSPSLKTFQSECEKGPQPPFIMWDYRWCWDVGGPPANFEFVTVGSCMGPRVSLDSGRGTAVTLSCVLLSEDGGSCPWSLWCPVPFCLFPPCLCSACCLLLQFHLVLRGEWQPETQLLVEEAAQGLPSHLLFLPQLCMQCVGADPWPPRKGRVSVFLTKVNTGAGLHWGTGVVQKVS